MTIDRMKVSLQTVKDNIAIMESIEEPDDAGYYLQLEHEKFVAEVIENQIPKKPVIKYHKEDLIPVKYGRLIEFHCPNCGRFIVATYETDAERGGGIHTDLRGCSTCLQAIDFTGYYHIDKLDEEIELE